MISVSWAYIQPNKIGQSIGHPGEWSPLYMFSKFAKAGPLLVSQTGFWVSLQMGSCFCTAKPLQTALRRSSLARLSLVWPAQPSCFVVILKEIGLNVTWD